MTNAEKMEALRGEIECCRDCGLCETRTNIVLGEGNPESPLMIVGEGPGATEDATGRPFVGRAGKLLDEALGELRMSRKHVFICNILKCRACVIDGRSVRNRPPLPTEVKACTKWLERQIEIVNPKVILSLGAPSARFIMERDFRMTKERGLFFPTKFAPAAIAGLHPAYILRKHGQEFEEAKGSLVHDIDSARKKVIELRKAGGEL